MSKKDKQPKSDKKSEDTSTSADKWRQLAEDEPTHSDDHLSDEDHEELDFPDRSHLEDQLTAMEKKAAEYKEKAVRSHAEMENLRRRTERDISNAHKYGTEKLITDLLPVADSMIRGLESSASEDPHTQSMREGIALTIELLNKTLLKHGVTVVDPQPGETFNPELHEAMSVTQDPKAKTNTILQVMQPGYQLNGRVLRAAMVVVAG